MSAGWRFQWALSLLVGSSRQHRHADRGPHRGQVLQ
jgi:hypothetical protein